MTKARSLSDFIESDGSVTLVDNQQIKIGTGNDLVLKHTGSNSVIHNTTGQLRVRANDLLISSYSNEEPYIAATENGAVTLYYDNSPKLATTSTGVSVTGALTSSGVVTANAGVVVDNITIDGQEIDVSSGDLTLDVAGDIILDATGSNVTLKAGGTSRFDFLLDDTPQLKAEGGTFDVQNQTSDADLRIRGNDGGVIITAVTFDMSAAGAATFNSSIAAASLDISGDIDVDGTTNLDVVDIDGAVDMASTLVSNGPITINPASYFIGNSTNGFRFNNSSDAQTLFYVKNTGEAVFNDNSIDYDFRVESNGNANMLFVDAGNDAVGVGCSTVGNSTLEVRSTGVDGTFANAIGFQYSGNANEANTISTSVSSNASQSGFKFNVSDGGGSSGKTNVASFLRNQIIFNEDSNDQDFRVESNGKTHMLFVDGGNNRLGIGTDSPNDIVDIHAPNSQLRLTDTDDSKFVQFSYSGGKLIVRNNSTNTAINQFTLTEDGKFGIGNFEPIAPLMIQGDAGSSQFTALALRQDDADGDNNTAMTCDIDFYLWDSNSRQSLPQGRIGLSSIDTGNQNTEAAGTLSFYTTPAGYPSSSILERLRITHNGRQKYNASATENGHGNFVGEVGNGYKALSFERTVGGGEVGSVVTNTSSTAYNTSSDYRLKENVNYDFDATTRLKQLKPARFNFTADSDTIVDGFLAHEVQDLVPEAISGEKDAMTSEVLYVEGDTIPEGKNVGDVMIAAEPVYQGIDQSKLVPLLVKTVQELEARIALLEE